MMKQKKHLKVPALAAGTTLVAAMTLMASCSTDYEDQIVYNDIQQPFQQDFLKDTLSFDKLPAEATRHILNLSDPSSEIVGKADYTFRTDNLISVKKSAVGDSLVITSWSAKPVSNVTLEMHIPEADEYIPVAFFDSIPAFSRISFRPSFIGRRNIHKKEDGKYVSFVVPYLDLNRMKARLTSDDEHFKMLQKIDAQWNCSFSNFGWTPTIGESYNFREMKPIYAREWVVILTNYAYMMTTPEYKYVMANFKKVMGGDLYDNEKVPFTAEKYQSEMERFKAKKNFVLGQTSPAYGGLGGGATWGITDWNFYGHYASFSGWESITHEFMHCMDYSHNSNMTYAAKTSEGVNVGWTEFIWQLHMWLSKKGDLPYTDRNLLGFHKPENAQYRDCDIRDIFQDDAVLQKNIDSFYKKSRLVKYFTENPLKDNTK